MSALLAALVLLAAAGLASCDDSHSDVCDPHASVECLCPAGKYSVGTIPRSPGGLTHSVCVFCAAGSYCEGDHYVNDPSYGLVVVRRGTHSCPAGTSSGPGAHSCTPCAAGRYEVSRIACAACPTGRYQDEAKKQSCKACPSHSESGTGSAHLSECHCIQGYTRGTNGHGAAVCRPCAAGTYKASISNEACTPCGDNTTQPLPGRISAASCLCAPGFYGGTAPHCRECEPGTFADVAGSHACTGCGPHADSPPRSTSRADCTCKAGTSGTDGFCAPCATGTYANGTGARTCTPCGPMATTAGPGASSRDECICVAGYAPDGDGNGTCSACGPGTFKPAAGNHACEECPAHSTHSLSAQMSQEACLCDPGFRHQPGSSGDSWCVECGADNYAASRGSSVCTRCPSRSGTRGHRGATGQNFCVCEPGYAGQGGVCAECPPDTYSGGGGDALCRTCPNNSATAGVRGAQNSSQCTGCQPRFYRSESGGACEPLTERPPQPAAVRVVAAYADRVRLELPALDSMRYGGATFALYSQVSETGTLEGRVASGDSIFPTGRPVPVTDRGVKPLSRYRYTLVAGNEFGRAFSPSVDARTPAAGCTVDLCVAGHTRAAGDGGACTLCPTGRFKEECGDGPCHQCPPGTEYEAGDDAKRDDVAMCRVCTRGKWSAGNGTRCEPCDVPAAMCPPGSASDPRRANLRKERTASGTGTVLCPFTPAGKREATPPCGPLEAQDNEIRAADTFSSDEHLLLVLYFMAAAACMWAVALTAYWLRVGRPASRDGVRSHSAVLQAADYMAFSSANLRVPTAPKQLGLGLVKHPRRGLLTLLAASTAALVAAYLLQIYVKHNSVETRTVVPTVQQHRGIDPVDLSVTAVFVGTTLDCQRDNVTVEIGPAGVALPEAADACRAYHGDGSDVGDARAQLDSCASGFACVLVRHTRQLRQGTADGYFGHDQSRIIVRATPKSGGGEATALFAQALSYEVSVTSWKVGEPSATRETVPSAATASGVLSGPHSLDVDLLAVPAALVSYGSDEIESRGVLLHHRATSTLKDEPADVALSSELGFRVFLEWSHYTQEIRVVPQTSASALLTSLAALGSLVFTAVRMLARVTDQAADAASDPGPACSVVDGVDDSPLLAEGAEASGAGARRRTAEVEML